MGLFYAHDVNDTVNLYLCMREVRHFVLCDVARQLVGQPKWIQV